ncbi:2'-5' RNA ligase family protein [Nocardia kruczakiae]|uniref:2'-5' RNA ligase family protein n=1 Tax=Nocardia kruczakiae TaxID=261477 RepID=UPI0007A52B3B|nr:2'-5' RNA ligase family protein [Nocardia kruczakiae]
MVQSVELVLDEAAETEIRRQWRMLSEAGMHSPTPQHRPHITVAVAREIWPRLDRTLAALPFRPLPIRLGGLLIFGARHPILVRLVVPTEELLTMQRRIAAVVDGCPGVPANMCPDAWTPHVTLARRPRPEHWPAAIDAVTAERDLAATVVGIRRWDGDRRIEWPIAPGGGDHG